MLSSTNSMRLAAQSLMLVPPARGRPLFVLAQA